MKIFIIENFAEGSAVARLEHNTETGLVSYFDSQGNITATKQLRDGERAWPTIDRKAESYYPISPYAFTNNNPILFVDPNGENSYHYNVVTGERIWVDDLGGSERQYVHFITPGEEGGFQLIGSGSVAGAEVFIGGTRDGWAMANIDLWQDLPDNLSGYEGYTYDVNDLQIRYEIRNGDSRVLKQALDNFERHGHAEPLTATNYWNLYGQTNGNLLLTDNYFRQMALAFTPSFGMNGASRSYGLSTTKGGGSGKAVSPSTTVQNQMSPRVKSLMNQRMMKGKNANR